MLRRSLSNVSLKTTRYPSPRIGCGVRAGGLARRAACRRAGLGAGWGHTLSPAAPASLVDAARHEIASTPWERPTPSIASTEAAVTLAATRMRLKKDWIEIRGRSDTLLRSGSLTFRPAAPNVWIDTLAANCGLAVGGGARGTAAKEGEVLRQVNIPRASASAEVGWSSLADDVTESAYRLSGCGRS